MGDIPALFKGYANVWVPIFSNSSLNSVLDSGNGAAQITSWPSESKRFIKSPRKVTNDLAAPHIINIRLEFIQTSLRVKIRQRYILLGT